MRPSRVQKTEWIEQQFLSGLSVHEFTPAPFEMAESREAAADSQECVTRRPLRGGETIGEVLQRPDNYLPPLDEHLPHSPREQANICASWLTTTISLTHWPHWPRCPGCGRPGMNVGGGAFGQQWICESQRYESGPAPVDPPPIDHDATAYRKKSRVIDCGDVEPEGTAMEDSEPEDVEPEDVGPDDGLMAGGPFWFWMFVATACTAIVLLALCEAGLIGP